MPTQIIAPCYDCGSTIPHHHTMSCDLAGENDKKDLPQYLGTQHWIGHMPELVGDLSYRELTHDEVEQLRSSTK